MKYVNLKHLRIIRLKHFCALFILASSYFSLIAAEDPSAAEDLVMKLTRTPDIQNFKRVLAENSVEPCKKINASSLTEKFNEFSLVTQDEPNDRLHQIYIGTDNFHTNITGCLILNGENFTHEDVNKKRLLELEYEQPAYLRNVINESITADEGEIIDEEYDDADSDAGINGDEEYDDIDSNAGSNGGETDNESDNEYE